MNIEITARHASIRQDVKDYAEQKLKKLAHYFSHIISIHLVLNIGKDQLRSVEIVVAAAGGATLVSEERNPDPFTAIDTAVHKLETQLRKHKEKLQAKHRRG